MTETRPVQNGTAKGGVTVSGTTVVILSDAAAKAAPAPILGTTPPSPTPFNPLTLFSRGPQGDLGPAGPVGLNGEAGAQGVGVVVGAGETGVVRARDAGAALDPGRLDGPVVGQIQAETDHPRQRQLRVEFSALK